MQTLLEAKQFTFVQLVKISPIMASKLLYWKTFKRRLNLDNPQTFNEKLMWLKLFEDIEFKTKFTDKVEARNYLISAGYPHLLVPIIDIFDRVEDIIFEQLPRKFVLRCSHGPGYEIVCEDKRELDYRKTRQQLAEWMVTDYSLQYAEPQYATIQPRIMIEYFIERSPSDIATSYKLHCFHGEPKIIELTINNSPSEELTIMLTPNWQNTHYIEKRVVETKPIQKPKQLDELLAIAKKLSKPFTYVRVDLAVIDENIYFDEFQFTPGACLENKIHEQANRDLGQWLQLDVQKLKQRASVIRLK